METKEETKQREQINNTVEEWVIEDIKKEEDNMKNIKTTLNINIKPYSNLLVENVHELSQQDVYMLANKLSARAKVIFKAIEKHFPNDTINYSNQQNNASNSTTKQYKSKVFKCYTCNVNNMRKVNDHLYVCWDNNCKGKWEPKGK